MFTIKDHWLGDSWTWVEGDRVHLFFLTCPGNIERHSRWSIGHAASTNLVDWEDHGILFDSDSTDPLKSCLSTGSVARFRDRFVMAFLSNHNQPDPQTAYAESDDLVRWSEVPDAFCRLSATSYTRRGSLAFKNPRWRDPFLFVEDGWLYQLMTAAFDERPPQSDGGIALMRTRDLRQWEYLPLLDTPPMGTDLECPKLYKVDGRYVLLVSLFNVLQSPEFAALQPEGLNSSTTFCLTADRLEGPYSFSGDGRVLRKDYPGCPYACEALHFKGSWYLLGTCWSDRLGDKIGECILLEAGPFGFRDTEDQPRRLSRGPQP